MAITNLLPSSSTLYNFSQQVKESSLSVANTAMAAFTTAVHLQTSAEDASSAGAAPLYLVGSALSLVAFGGEKALKSLALRKAQSELGLEVGADINAQDATTGMTVLRAAVLQRKTELVNWLLETGATVDSITLEGAVYDGQIEMIRSLLQKIPANLDLKEPLLMAVQKGDAETVRLLLEAGADANEKFSEHETILNQALILKHKAVVSALLERGEIDLEAPCDLLKDKTPFEVAQETGQEDLATRIELEILLEHSQRALKDLEI